MAGSGFGTNFRITTWGETHGAGVGVVVDGCPAGLPLEREDVQKYLDRRKPGQSKYTTQRKEGDQVKKGMPFRDAYKISGTLVAKCIRENLTLETLPLEAYQEMTPLFTEDIYDAISLETCVKGRVSQGGPSPKAVAVQLEQVKNILASWE